MAFSKIVEIFSAASSRFSAPTGPYMLSGSSPRIDSAAHGLGFGYSGHKINMRLSSSLQDFSSYKQHGHEEIDPNLGNDGNINHAKQLHPLPNESALLSFSKDKRFLGSTSFVWKKRMRVILVFLCLLLFALLMYMIVAYCYSNWSQEVSKFYVVLDCGSTGTRVYVYQASINHGKDGNLPFVLKTFTGFRSKSNRGRAYDRMETEPGFDKLVYNVSGLKTAVKPLLKWAEKQIPKHAHKTTSLFLYATAGVRRLPRAESKWLLDTAWSILKRSPFVCQRDWIKIISGMEEAYFGWVALNYHTGMLGSTPKKATFGALDLGGSSLQVTFETNEDLHNDTSLNLKFGPLNHHLSAYSLSGYGLNDAFDKTVTQLFRSLPETIKANVNKGNIELKHPCLHSGYKDKYTCSRCVSNYPEGVSPMIGGRNAGKGVKVGIPVNLVGAPNWEKCNALAKGAINLSEWSNGVPGIDCNTQPCALPNSLPRPYGQFYAMSGFFVVYRFFNLTSEATLDDILEKGRGFCERTWEVAKSSVPPQPFIEQYCFRAPYIVLLLREGLRIIDKQILIGSGSITWTLGVALLEAGKVSSARMGIQSYQVFHMKISPGFLIAILFVSLFFLVCTLLYVGNWIPRFFRISYIPLYRQNSASPSSGRNFPSPFRFQHWSPISSGDGRVKMPLSPTVAGSQQRPFGLDHGLGGSSMQLMESSFYPPASSVSHSYSSSTLGQMQFDSSSMASFWPPHRSQMRLQSRRSQSREDLNSQLAEAHTVKV